MLTLPNAINDIEWATTFLARAALIAGGLWITFKKKPNMHHYFMVYY